MIQIHHKVWKQKLLWHVKGLPADFQHEKKFKRNQRNNTTNEEKKIIKKKFAHKFNSHHQHITTQSFNYFMNVSVSAY